MGTRNPEEEIKSWKEEIAPAIEISCRSHYGTVAKLPMFPWFLDQAGSPEVKELLNRLVRTSNYDARGFSTEVANYLGKTELQRREKLQFLQVNQMDIASILQCVRDLRHHQEGESRVMVRISSGSRGTLGVHSKSSKKGNNEESGVTVDMSLERLTVDVERMKNTEEVYSEPPKEMLTELSLEKLMLPMVIVEKDVSLSDGGSLTLEMSLKLAEGDKEIVLQEKLTRLEELKKATDEEVARLRGIIDGVMSALDIKDDPKRKKDVYRERGCDYCKTF